MIYTVNALDKVLIHIPSGPEQGDLDLTILLRIGHAVKPKLLISGIFFNFLQTIVGWVTEAMAGKNEGKMG